MFAWLAARPEQMPPRFQQRAARCGVARTVADYLAGMTDRFALQEQERLLGGAGR
jgi:dGTPase